MKNRTGPRTQDESEARWVVADWFRRIRRSNPDAALGKGPLAHTEDLELRYAAALRLASLLDRKGGPR